uniref:Uncharacterized protein n=1 Tax=Anguilla anguilla TaxID=7936 RepID=A0A0E9VJT9_ANGAN
MGLIAVTSLLIAGHIQAIALLAVFKSVTPVVFIVRKFCVPLLQFVFCDDGCEKTDDYWDYIGIHYTAP